MSVGFTPSLVVVALMLSRQSAHGVDACLDSYRLPPVAFESAEQDAGCQSGLIPVLSLLWLLAAVIASTQLSAAARSMSVCGPGEFPYNPIYILSHWSLGATGV